MSLQEKLKKWGRTAWMWLLDAGDWFYEFIQDTAHKYSMTHFGMWLTGIIQGIAIIVILQWMF